MFRCCECGCEFEQKPDFCDCGNNTFTEIPSVSDFQQPQKQKPAKKKKTFDEQYPELSRYIETLDPISVGIFLTCIVLSVLTFVFIKPNEKTEEKTPLPETKITRNVADINTFWDDTPPVDEKKIINIDITNNEKVTKPEQPVQVIKKEPVKPKVKQTTSLNKKTSKQSAQPVSKKVQQKTTVTKPTQSTKTSAQKPAQTTVTPQQKTTTSTQQTQTPQPAVVNSVPTQTIKTSNSSQTQQELNNYKTGLRNTIGRKIDFTKVYGNGTCVVSFSINSSGRLVDRKFTTQSTNNTLNDVVFEAVKSTPTYKTPPSSYNGQTLYLTVKYINGSYSVSLK